MRIANVPTDGKAVRKVKQHDATVDTSRRKEGEWGSGEGKALDAVGLRMEGAEDLAGLVGFAGAGEIIEGTAVATDFSASILLEGQAGEGDDVDHAVCSTNNGKCAGWSDADAE